MKCKVTGEKIEPFMSFGKMPSANGFLGKEKFKEEPFYEMEVGFSKKCSLLQLNEFPKPENIHNENYPFYTSSSNYMINHFNKFSKWLREKYLFSGSKLIEIGSNDGTLLKNFYNTGVDAIGFEPSESVAKIAIDNKIKTLKLFFNTETINEAKNFKGRTDVICSANVVAHIPDLKNVMETVDLLLSNDGVFIFEDPYLGSMFSNVSYDQIYDEHIYLFSLSSVKKIANLFDFELIDAIKQVTHGGSMRYVVSRKGKHKISDTVNHLLDNERENKLDDLESCLNFKKNCENSRNKTIATLKKMKDKGKKICGYGATAKSSTILNYCKIGPEIIDFISDTTKEKIGKYSPGAHIPIVSVDHFHKSNSDIAYLFAWNHKEEIFEKEKNFLKNGGQWFSHVNL
jgi:SAM-dependent methyltransferase